MKSNWIKYLSVLLFFNLIPLLIIDLFLITEKDLLASYLRSFSEEQALGILETSKNWKWLSYLFSVLLLASKTLLVGSILWLATFLINNQISFSKLFLVGIKSQVIFILKPYILLVLVLLNSDSKLEIISNFTPLSLFSLFKGQSLDGYLAFLFQSLNLFEVAYWFLLAYFLSKELKSTLNDGLKVVVSSYIPAFVLWLVTVTFFLVSNS